MPPIAVGARGDAAIALGHRLLALSDEALGDLKGVAGKGLLLVLGQEEILPWVNGVVYFGRDERAPGLLLPTTIEPSVPLELYERAILGRPGAAAPIAVFIGPRCLARAGNARPIARDVLAAWLESQG